MRKWLTAGGLVAAMASAGSLVAQERDAIPAAPRPVSIAPPSVPYPSTRVVRYEPVEMAVELAAGATPLWQGNIRVGDYSASYNQSLNQAPELCPEDKTRLPRYSNTTQSVRVTITRRVVGSSNDEQFGVSASWTRPGPPCGGGVSTVSFDRTVSLKPGASAELAGDAGLVIRVSRKQ